MPTRWFAPSPSSIRLGRPSSASPRCSECFSRDESSGRQLRGQCVVSWRSMRTAHLLALLICLFAASTRSASWAQEAPITFAAVETMAAKLASQPYKEPPSIEGDMRGLGYDQYRALRQRSDSALWR